MCMYHTLHVSADTWRFSVLEISLPVLSLLLRNSLPVYSSSERSSPGNSNAKKAILSLSLCCLSFSPPPPPHFLCAREWKLEFTDVDRLSNQQVQVSGSPTLGLQSQFTVPGFLIWVLGKPTRVLMLA